MAGMNGIRIDDLLSQELSEVKKIHLFSVFNGDSVQFLKTLIVIIITFYCRAVPNQRVKHQCSVHEHFIRDTKMTQIAERFYLGRRGQAIPYPDTMTMPAVRAGTVYGYAARGAHNSDPVFCGVALER
jgi:hypothetical protein